MNQPKRRGRPPGVRPIAVTTQLPGENASYAVITPAMLERVPEATIAALIGDGVPEPVITWSEFASYIRNSGAVVKASYPAPQFDVIQTIWCGVPVIVGEPAVMDKHQNWTKL